MLKVSGSLLKRSRALETENANAFNHISHLHFSESLLLPLAREVFNCVGKGLQGGEKYPETLYG